MPIIRYLSIFIFEAIYNLTLPKNLPLERTQALLLFLINVMLGLRETNYCRGFHFIKLLTRA